MIMPQFRRISSVLADKTVNFAGLREAPRGGDSRFSHLCGCAKVHTRLLQPPPALCSPCPRLTPLCFHRKPFPITLRPSCIFLRQNSDASFDASPLHRPLNLSAQSLNPITYRTPAAATSSGLSCYKLKVTLLLSRPRDQPLASANLPPNGGRLKSHPNRLRISSASALTN